MANGASRIFEVLKRTSEATNISPSKVITLLVKSTNPIVYQRDDRLEITEDFCTYNNEDAKGNLAVGDKVTALVLNDGQSYYIQLDSGKGEKGDKGDPGPQGPKGDKRR